MSEHDEQTTFFALVRLNRKHAPSQGVRDAMGLCYAVPNGANLPKKKYQDKNGKWKTWSPEAKWLIAEGLTEGILDINLDMPITVYVTHEEDSRFEEIKNNHKTSYPVKSRIKHMYPGLRIEMKFGKNKLTTEQKEKKALLEEAGFKVAVCYSAVEAIRAVFDYLPFEEKDYQGIREYLW